MLGKLVVDADLRLVRGLEEEPGRERDDQADDGGDQQEGEERLPLGRPVGRRAAGAAGVAGASGAIGRPPPRGLEQRRRRVREAPRVDERVRHAGAARPLRGVLDRRCPDVLDEHGRHGRARREGLRQLGHRGAGQAAAVVGERTLGRLPALGRVEAEAEERPDRASRAAAAQVDRRDLLDSASRCTKSAPSTRSAPPLSRRSRAPTRPPSNVAPGGKA